MKKLLRLYAPVLILLGLFVSVKQLYNMLPEKDNQVLALSWEVGDAAELTLAHRQALNISLKEAEAASSPGAFAVRPEGLVGSSGSVFFEKGDMVIEYDLSVGTADFYQKGQRIISSFYSGVKLPHLITSRDYASRTVIKSENEYIVLNTSPGKPEMRQIFSLEDEGYFTVKIELIGANLSSNWMAPILADEKGGVDIGSKTEAIALWIPFDNDRDVHFIASTLNTQDTSYEAAAFYDNATRNGLIIGSVTHDTWKTGIDYSGSDNKLDLLQVYGGAGIQSTRHSDMVRDVEPHGYIKGDIITSPTIFAGYFEDWRTGMETYALANTKIVPSRPWDGGVIFGWNSWGAAGAAIDTHKALTAADFIKENLMPEGFINHDTAYINLDSYWDSASVNLALFVETVHRNGQKAGIYWSPFVDWAKEASRRVEGTDYAYGDIWLRDSRGNPITYDNGPYALDPTHPGTQERIDYYIDYFKQKGFDAYIKLDFLTHAALEGRHYDSTVTTGMQAMNKGMEYLMDSISSHMSPDTFVSQAISPLFPYQYAHARRFSCDKFGFLYESRDVANAAAYGFWMNNGLYAYNDPDHLSLYSVWWNKDAKLSENEARTRVATAVISGTVFLSGDDYTDPGARERATKYLTNPNINHIARLGKAFRPLEGNTGTSAPEVFTLDNGDGTYYIAVFNWDGLRAANMIIDLNRAGLDPLKRYTATEQWSGDVIRTAGTLSIKLSPAESRIYLLK